MADPAYTVNVVRYTRGADDAPPVFVGPAADEGEALRLAAEEAIKAAQAEGFGHEAEGFVAAFVIENGPPARTRWSLRKMMRGWNT